MTGPGKRTTCPLYHLGNSCPEEVAVVCGDQQWTWLELEERVQQLSGYLHCLGPEGSRIAVQMATSADYVALILSALRTEHVLVPLSNRLPEEAADKLAEMVQAEAVIRTIPECKGIREAHTTLLLDTPATIVFTSGSTGTPKAALHTLSNHISSASGVIDAMHLKQRDRWLLALPLNHVGGLAVVYRCLLAGAAIVIPNPHESPGACIQHQKVTHASLVSTQFSRLLKEQVDVSSLKAVLLGGSAISQNLLVSAFSRSIPTFVSYGSTEMSSTVTIASSEEVMDAPGMAGSVLEGRQIKLVEEEIRVRGETLFAGYVNGNRLIKPFDSDGWFATGDLGRLDESGRLIVYGRKDDMFISGGENIFPEEIENALVQYPGVIQAVVVPVPDEEFGFRPVAFIRGEKMANTEELTSYLRTVLPSFKVPDAMFDMPKISGLKPRREELRHRAAKLYQ